MEKWGNELNSQLEEADTERHSDRWELVVAIGIVISMSIGVGIGILFANLNMSENNQDQYAQCINEIEHLKVKHAFELSRKNFAVNNQVKTPAPKYPIVKKDTPRRQTPKEPEFVVKRREGHDSWVYQIDGSKAVDSVSRGGKPLSECKKSNDVVDEDVLACMEGRLIKNWE